MHNLQAYDKRQSEYNTKQQNKNNSVSVHRTDTCLTASFSRTTWVSWHQKGQANLDFNKAKDDVWQWHQLDDMQIICTSLQTDNHTSISSLKCR